jgi:hypothetical protein
MAGLDPAIWTRAVRNVPAVPKKSQISAICGANTILNPDINSPSLGIIFTLKLTTILWGQPKDG